MILLHPFYIKNQTNQIMKTLLSCIFILTISFSLFGQTEEPLKIEDSKEEQLTKKKKAFKVIDRMPRFPGCEEKATIKEKKVCSEIKLLQFIQQNITAPDSAKIKGINGRCYVTFYIEADGSVNEVKLVRDIGLGCGEEALRVVNLMVEQNIIWIPGEIEGEKTRVKFNLPVHFRIPKQVVRKKRNRKRRSKN